MLSKLESIETIIFGVRNNCIVQVRAVQVITTFRICRICLNIKIIHIFTKCNQIFEKYLIPALKIGGHSFPSYPRTHGYLCYLNSYQNFTSFLLNKSKRYSNCSRIKSIIKKNKTNSLFIQSKTFNSERVLEFVFVFLLF